VLSGRPRRAAGSEALVFTNGSALRPHPPTRDGLHGEQSDHNDVDEAWAYDEVQGDGVLQAIEPTQATRPGAQTWIWSTRGDRNSTWFHGLINRAYSGEPGFALFDFGIPTTWSRPTRTWPPTTRRSGTPSTWRPSPARRCRPGSGPAPTATGRPGRGSG
jgi:hypothetical protein